MPKLNNRLRAHQLERGLTEELNDRLSESSIHNTAKKISALFSNVQIIDGAAWADRYRVMGKDSRYRRWSTERTPYLREVARAMSSTNPAEKIVVIAKSAQMGCTEIALNEVLRRMHTEPCPILFYLENDDKADEWKRMRLITALAQPPFSGRARASGATVEFGKATLYHSGVGSSSSLSSKPARLVVGDECARYANSIGGEGDFLGLAEGRTTTFGDLAKIILLSTPTNSVRGEGSFLSYFEAGDCREYQCECVHCGHYSAWTLEACRRVGDSAGMVCPSCGGLTMDGEERTRAIASGRWQPTREPTNKSAISFHINSFIAPAEWLSWISILDNYRNAIAGTAGASLQAFYNLRLGLPFDEPEARVPTASAVKAAINKRDAFHKGFIPNSAYALTLGVDVQKTYLYFEVKAWGRALESWSVAQGTIDARIGDTELVVGHLRALFQKDWPREDDKLMRLWLGCIDCGYSTSEVYAVCANFPSPTILRGKYITPFGSLTPTKGAGQVECPRLIMSELDKQSHRGKRPRKKFWLIGTDYAKHELYRTLNQIIAGDADQIKIAMPHFPIDYSNDYFDELVSEQIITTRHRSTNRLQRAFKLANNVANEALDVHVLNRVAAEILGLEKFTAPSIAKLVAQMGGGVEIDRTAEPDIKAQKRAAVLAARKEKRTQRREARKNKK